MITAGGKRTLQESLNAARGGHLYIPAGTYYVDTPLVYDAAKNGPITISGDGAGTKLVARGAATILHIKGLMGADVDHVRVIGLRFVPNGGVGLHMEGVAIYSLRDLYVTGAAEVGLRLTGTQQGEIAGGFIGRGVKDGVVLEKLPSGIASNGCDMHGVSFMCENRSVAIDGADSFFMHACHSALARVGVDVVASGYGPLNVTDSHLELHAEAAIRCRSTVRIARNNFFSPPGSHDVIALEGSSSIEDNLVQGVIRIDAACEDVIVVDNKMVGAARIDNLGKRTQLRFNR